MHTKHLSPVFLPYQQTALAPSHVPPVQPTATATPINTGEAWESDLSAATSAQHLNQQARRFGESAPELRVSITPARETPRPKKSIAGIPAEKLFTMAWQKLSANIEGPAGKDDWEDVLDYLDAATSRFGASGKSAAEKLRWTAYLSGYAHLRAGRPDRAREYAVALKAVDRELAGLLLQDIHHAVTPPVFPLPQPVAVAEPLKERSARISALPDSAKAVLARQVMGRLLEWIEVEPSVAETLAGILAADAVIDLASFALENPAAALTLANAAAGELPPRARAEIGRLMTGFGGGALPRPAVEALCLTPDFSLRRQLIAVSLAPETVAKAKSALSNAVNALRAEEVPSLALLLNRESGIAGDSQIADVLRQVIPAYYNNLPTHRKARLWRGQIELDSVAPLEERLFQLMQHSGPAMKKLFQMYGKKLASPKLREALARLQDDIEPYPGDVSLQIIADDYGVDALGQFLSFSQKPVAAASVAQVHAAVLLTANGPVKVAAKVRRPDYQEWIGDEFGLLDQVAMDDFAREVVEKLKQALLREGDLRIEAGNVPRVALYRTAGTVKLIDKFPATERTLMMEWINDPTHRRLGWENLEDLVTRHRDLSAVFHEWATRALAGDGFFHGDPHGGNLTYNPRARRAHRRYHYLDDALTATLTKDQQEHFASLAAALALRREKWAADSLIALSGGSRLSAATRRKLEAVVRKHMRSLDPPIARVGMLLGDAVKAGAPLPDSALEFQRGLMLFESELTAIKDTLKERGGAPLMARLGLKWNAPETILARVVAARYGRKFAATAAKFGGIPDRA